MIKKTGEKWLSKFGLTCSWKSSLFKINKLYFSRAVLDSQHNCMESMESSHIPRPHRAQPPSVQTFAPQSSICYISKPALTHRSGPLLAVCVLWVWTDVWWHVSTICIVQSSCTGWASPVLCLVTLPSLLTPRNHRGSTVSIILPWLEC